MFSRASSRSGDLTSRWESSTHGLGLPRGENDSLPGSPPNLSGGESMCERPGSVRLRAGGDESLGVLVAAATGHSVT